MAWDNAKRAATRRFFNGAIGRELIEMLETSKPRVNSKDFEEAALLAQRRFGQEDILEALKAAQIEQDESTDPTYQPIDTSK